jgi:head-tail adaptor
MPSAGALRHRLIFEFRAPLPGGDGAGNFEGEWTESFRCWAAMTPKFGGEAVIAARLQGRQTWLVTVRQSNTSAQVTPDWRIRNERNQAQVFAIHTVNKSVERFAS